MTDLHLDQMVSWIDQAEHNQIPGHDVINISTVSGVVLGFGGDEITDYPDCEAWTQHREIVEWYLRAGRFIPDAEWSRATRARNNILSQLTCLLLPYVLAAASEHRCGGVMKYRFHRNQPGDEYPFDEARFPLGYPKDVSDAGTCGLGFIPNVHDAIYLTVPKGNRQEWGVVINQELREMAKRMGG